MKIKYTLTEVAPKVFHVVVDDSYNLAMLFCRAQEFYESPYKEIRGKHFTLLQFMEIYSKRCGRSSFTYAEDWAGFNVPGKAIEELFSEPIIDFNHYDKTIYEIHKKIGISDYYLIGSVPKDKKTIEHETAHAFYTIDKSYKKTALKLVNNLPKTLSLKIEKHLKAIGYSDKTMKDELHAYILTEPKMLKDEIKFNKKEIVQLKEANKLFRDNFNAVVDKSAQK